jgi:hypothetical protein
LARRIVTFNVDGVQYYTEPVPVLLRSTLMVYTVSTVLHVYRTGTCIVTFNVDGVQYYMYTEPVPVLVLCPVGEFVLQFAIGRRAPV